ncbi:MAG: IS1595 family transposase [Phycisphaerales bacterium]|nr:IS1595 family transposase [Phycisphaerales bacterium]
MSVKNRYVVRSRISEAAFRRFLRHVAADLTAVQITQLTGLNRNTVNRLLACLRLRMAQVCELGRPFRGTVEVDESYFGPRRVKGRRGRGAARKTPVFGIFKRHGKVYTEPVSDCSKAVPLAAIRGRVSLDSIIHSDGWVGYDGLVDMGYKKHLRVDHSANEFSSRRIRGNHINRIEGFRGYAKSRLARFRGMHPSTFLFHLKGCEFRFNHRQQDLYRVLLTLCRNNPLS